MKKAEEGFVKKEMNEKDQMERDQAERENMLNRYLIQENAELDRSVLSYLSFPLEHQRTKVE